MGHCDSATTGGVREILSGYARASKVVGGLLAIIGLLGVLILTFDRILWETAPAHAYALIVFVIIDFAAGVFVFAKPASMAFTLAGVWSAARIIIQIGDILLGPSLGLPYAQFAGYLFNPAYANPPNPTGIPGAPIDLIVILEIVVIWVSWKARSSVRRP
jgi:F0F1-type ATP synthase assembly protein I